MDRGFSSDPLEVFGTLGAAPGDRRSQKIGGQKGSKFWIERVFLGDAKFASQITARCVEEMGGYQFGFFAPLDAVTKYTDFIQGIAFPSHSTRSIISTVMFAQMAVTQVLLGLFCILGEHGDVHERRATHERLLDT